jgi:ABC-type Fe3+ transport system permease subunit
MTGVEIIIFFTCRCFFMFYKKQSTKAKSEQRNEKESPQRLSRNHKRILMVVGIATIILVILIVVITLAISFSISVSKDKTTIATSTTSSITTTTTTGKLAGSSTMSGIGRAKL